MRIGLSAAAFFSRMETEEQAAFLNRFTLDTCEMFLETHSEYTAEFGKLVRKNLGDLSCDSVHPKGTLFESELFGGAKRQRADARQAFRGVLAAGKIIGAKYYIWHGPHRVQGGIEPWQIRDLETVFPELQREAAEQGIEILWENVFWASMKGPEEIRWLQEHFPDLHFVLDIKQAWRAGHTWQEMLEVMGEKCRHVHVLDQRADGSLCLPGEGIVDFPALFAALRSLNYQGVVLLEPYEELTRDDQRLQRSLDYLKSL